MHTKKKFTLAFSLLLFVMVCFTACGNSNLKPDENGMVKAELGQTIQAVNRSFTVVSAQPVSSFGNYTPLDGEQLIEIVIETKNTSKETLSLTDVDYQLQWGTEGFTDALATFDSNQTLLDFETNLDKGKTVEYHYLYSVPNYTAAFSICYSDVSTDGSNSFLYYCEFTI